MSSASAAEMTVDPAGLRARAQALAAVRRWFDHHGYLEVPTPVLVPAPAMEAQLHAVSAGDGWLRTSPEFALKRVLAAGLPRIYEVGPCFRERERGRWHGREFTMLEWYRAGAELTDLMDEVEALVGVTCAALGVVAPASRHDTRPTAAGQWRRVGVRALFRACTGVDLAHATIGEISPDDETWSDAFFRRWVADVEPQLTGPTFVDDWPASQAALARTYTDGAFPTAGRFEVYLGGVELGNAFFELIDAAEQARRFGSSNAERIAFGEAPHPVDPAFVAAVGQMPRSAGIAVGVDRLVAAVSRWPGIAPGRVAVAEGAR
jgi:lysyl-tRNA synthetase class 2